MQTIDMYGTRIDCQREDIGRKEEEVRRMEIDDGGGREGGSTEKWG